MIKNLFAISALIAICLISSCSPVVYAPVGQNVPLLKTNGDVTFNASLATTEDAGGVGLQFASALDSSFALISSLYLMGHKSENEMDGTSSDWEGHGSYFEIGAGKFGKIAGKKSLRYEVFGGLGFGGIKNSLATSQVDVGFIKPFIQPSISVGNDWVEFAFTPRLAFLSYTRQDVRTSDDFLRAEAEDYFREKKSSLIFEPGITLRVGGKIVKGQLQFTGTTHNYEPEDYIEVNNTFFSLGVQVYLSKDR